jgi:hypothetical protein
MSSDALKGWNKGMANPRKGAQIVYFTSALGGGKAASKTTRSAKPAASKRVAKGTAKGTVKGTTKGAVKSKAKGPVKRSTAKANPKKRR